MKVPDDAFPDSWHRHFASRANNEAWPLAERPRDQVEALALLNAAHASAWHWQAIGTELNRMRALMLLAQAHAQAGLGASAMSYADSMRAFFLATPSTPDWELAFVHAIHANAAFTVGDKATHADSYARAERAVAAIVDAEDREIVVRLFDQVPRP